MSIKISFKKNIPSKYIKNYVLFVNEDFKINGLSKIQLQKDSVEYHQGYFNMSLSILKEETS